MKKTPDAIDQITESVSRLDVPPPFLYRQVHLEKIEQIERDKSRLVRERDRSKNRAYQAAMIVMRNGGYKPETKQTYLKRIGRGD